VKNADKRQVHKHLPKISVCFYGNLEEPQKRQKNLHLPVRLYFTINPLFCQEKTFDIFRQPCGLQQVDAQKIFNTDLRRVAVETFL